MSTVKEQPGRAPGTTVFKEELLCQAGLFKGMHKGMTIVSAVMVLAFVLNGLALALMLPAMILPVVLFSLVYSYFVWRRATDRDLDPELII